MASEASIRAEESVFQKKYHTRVTTLCNNNCVFCLVDKTDGDCHKKLPELKEELTSVRKNGFQKLILSGGEPTIHPEIIKIVSFANELDFEKIQIITNGRMFFYPNFTRNIINAGLDEITFSIHGHNAKLHDSLTRSPGSFAQALNGIRNASEFRGLIINADIVLTGMNYASLPQIAEFLMDEGVMELNFHSLTPFGNAYDNLKKVGYDFGRVAPYLHKAIDACKSRGAYVWTSRFPPQYLYGYEEFIRDSYKILDEMAGRKDMFQNTGAPLCKGSRCTYCKLNLICGDIQSRNSILLGETKAECVSLDPSYACNNDCIFCIGQAKPYENAECMMSLEGIKKKLDEGITLSRNLRIGGGEPTMSPHLLETVSYAKKIGYENIQIESNGRAFAQKDFAKKIVGAGASHVEISILGDSQQLHDAITRREGSFEEAISGITNLKEGGARVTTNTVLTKQNCARMPQIAKFLKGISEKSHLSYVAPRGWLYKDYMPLAEDLKAVSAFVAEAIEILRPRVAVRNIPVCFFGKKAGEYAKYVQTDPLDLRLNELEGGKLDVYKFTERNHARIKIKGLQCTKCAHTTKCKGVFKKYIRLYGFKSLCPENIPA